MSHDFDLTLDMPKGVSEMKLDDIVKWLEQNNRVKCAGNFKPIQVANILNNIFIRVGLRLDNEQMIFLLDDSNRLLCEASAGSGKTTVSQLKMLKYKMLYGIDGSDILAIAYNDHAAEDMQRRHSQLVDEIMSQRINGVKLNSRIVCRTFHSNALAWIKEYAPKCGITNRETIVITDLNETKFMQNALESALRKIDAGSKKIEITPNMVPDLIAFNSYIEERMLKVEECETLPKFTDISLPLGVVSASISKFNKLCDFNSMYTFSRILVKFYELLRDNEDVKKRVQGAYKVFLIDEYQDMSPLMNEIIFLMLGDNVTFNAIGDGDQSIYSFKGTDSLNCLKFKNYFKDGKVVSMGANRRCRKTIVDTARNILSINTLRYPKELHSIKDGGSVKTVPYETQSEQFNIIVHDIKNIPTEELYKICIAYRNKESSLLLTKMLLDARIPFIVKSGYEPFKDTMSRSLYDIFAMLRNPTNKAYHKSALYKVLPANRQQIAQVINDMGDDSGLVHYSKYDWSVLGGMANSIQYCISILMECEECVKNKSVPMKNYFNKVHNLFCKYYWNWVREQTRFPVGLEESLIRDFGSERPYSEFIKWYHEQAEIRDRFASNGIGVRLTTFHGLKGLEFDKVYLVDMQESIFPNYKKIEKECAMNEQAELEEKEECVRLFYVACTRPRDELVVMYNSNEPSTFIDLLHVRDVEQVKEKRKEDVSIEEDFDLSDIIEEDEFNINTEIADTEVVEEKINQSLVDVNVEEFQVPDIADEEITIDIDIDKTEVRNERNIPYADHDMYMYHEPSGGYYMIPEGEQLYQSSSIDFESSVEITEEEYQKGMREQMADEEFNNVPKKEEPTNKVDKTLGILALLGD